MTPNIIRSDQRDQFIGERGNSFSKDKAQARAERIKAVWMNCGYLIRVWLEPITRRNSRGESTGWVVRSNLINGMPPKGSRA